MFNQKYAISVELTAAREAVDAARAQCKKLAEQVDTTAVQAITLEADVKRLTAERAAEEGALALCEAGDVKRHEKTVERLTTELETKERELRRARAKIEALEGMAPGLDEAVTITGQALHVELGIWMQGAVTTLSAEVAEAAKPLAAVMAKARAFGGPELLDFLAASYVPAPEGFARYMTLANGWYNQGENLLAEAPGTDMAADASTIAAQIRPVREAISVAQLHRRYVPIAKRPGPYVRKGIEVSGSDFSEKRRAQAALTDKPAQRQPEPQELNMGPVMVENIGRAPQQAQQ